MSASKRLRALDREMTPGPWRASSDGAELFSDGLVPQPVDFDKSSVYGIARVRNALPLIADAVEAAERMRNMGLTPTNADLWALAAALADLEKALSA